jgi:hypothetical protein
MARRFTYDERTRRYRAPNGKFVTNVRGVLDATLDKSGKEVKALAQSLRDGKINLTDFRQAMRDNIKSSHLASTALAKGGWQQMTQADMGRAGARIRREYGMLERMIQQIGAGEQRLDGTLLRRSEMYTQSARGTYHDAERVEQARRGVSQERRVLGQADHCEDCVTAAAIGWAAIGTLPRIGESVCRVNCRCVFEFKEAA